jgi:signal peptidase I
MNRPVQREEAAVSEQAAAHAGELRQFFRLTICILIGIVAIRALVLESCPVLGPSMSPTLEEGERILVLKLPVLLARLGLPGFHQPFATGDLIVFQGDDGRRYVKRVIAAGGNADAAAVHARGDAPQGTQVRYENGAVFVDNRRIEEPYLTPEQQPPAQVHELTLDPGEYYVLGDNRRLSRDSRAFNAVPAAQVIGRPVLRFWPLSRFGTLP